MVELERRNTAVIAASHAPAARILDEQSLHLPPTAAHRFGPAPSTAVTTARHATEHDHSVTRAIQDAAPIASGECLPPFGPLRRQAVLGEPVPDRGSAAIDLAGDLDDRQTGRHQLRQPVASDRALRSVPFLIDGSKSVLGDPVPDGRFMPPHPPSDLREREPLGEKLFEVASLHEEHRAIRRTAKYLQMGRFWGASVEDLCPREEDLSRPGPHSGCDPAARARASVGCGRAWRARPPQPARSPVSWSTCA